MTSISDRTAASTRTSNAHSVVPSAILSWLGAGDQTVSADDEDIRGRKVRDSNGMPLGHIADLLIGTSPTADQEVPQ